MYRPALLGRARLHFVRKTYGVDLWQDRELLQQLGGELPDDLWQSAVPFDSQSATWDAQPVAGAEFAPVPAELLQARSYSTFGRKLRDFLYASEALSIWKSSSPKQYSRPDETEGDFRARLAHLAREARDAKVEKLRQGYAAKLASLEKRRVAAESRVAKEKSQARRASYDSAVSIGSSILGALLGRKLASRTNVGRAATSMRSLGRAADQRGDVGEANAALEKLNQEQADLEQQFQRELDDIEYGHPAEGFELESLSVPPRKSDIELSEVSVAWVPWHVEPGGAKRLEFSL